MTEVITPKTIFYIKLNSEADMPTALSFAYKQNTKREVLVPRELVWSYDMTEAEYQAYCAIEEISEDDPDPCDFVTVPDGVTVTSYGSNDVGTLTLEQWTPAEYGENMIPDGDPYLVAYTRDYSIDVIGVMHEPTGNMLTDAEGNEYPEQAPIDGWHVNIKLHGESEELRNLVEELDATNGANPATPNRIWL